MDVTEPLARQPATGRERVASAALTLFARHGVAATSLQMIADELGVTKAAVYHHFKSKGDILLAVLEPAVASVEAIVRVASAHDSARARVESVIAGLADQAVQHRHLYLVLLRDVVVAQLITRRARYRDAFGQLHSALTGPDPDSDRVLRVSMFLTGLQGPAVDPACAGLDDATLRSGIARAGRALLLDV